MVDSCSYMAVCLFCECCSSSVEMCSQRASVAGNAQSQASLLITQTRGDLRSAHCGPGPGPCGATRPRTRVKRVEAAAHNPKKQNSF